MPQLEGIEDPSPTASAVWLSRQKVEDGENKNPWKPLRKVDCRAMNRGTNEKEILVEGGKCTAFPNQSKLVHNFTREPDRELGCATWFVVTDESKQRDQDHDQCDYLEPIFDKEDSSKIEALYQKVVSASSAIVDQLSTAVQEHVELGDQSLVQVVKTAGKRFSFRRYPKGWLKSSQALQRGYGSYTVAGEDNESLLGPVKHLIFVIHGIGETMFSKPDISFPSLLQKTNEMRAYMEEKQIKDWRKACEFAVKNNEEIPPVPSRIELIPIEWFDQLHNENSMWVKSLQTITLPTIPALRGLANDVILDVLFYMTPTFCQSVLENVTNQICMFQKKFLQVHPEFEKSGGVYSLMGHSLGSIIAWDLLALKKATVGSNMSSDQGIRFDDGAASFAAQEELASQDYGAKGAWGPTLTGPIGNIIPFKPEHTVFLGSPVGMFLTLRGAHGVFEKLIDADEGLLPPSTSSFALPTQQLYNIFHPSDPVAYRIEPLLLSTTSDDVPPPLYLTPPGTAVKAHLKMKMFTEDLRKTLQSQKASWNSLLTTAVTAFAPAENLDQQNTRSTQTEPLRFELGGDDGRIDYCLQTGLVDNEYLRYSNMPCSSFSHVTYTTLHHQCRASSQLVFFEFGCARFPFDVALTTATK